MNDVRVIVNDLEGNTKEAYKTTKSNLCKLKIFKEWFRICEIYQDYIEIGEEGYSGLSNLMLFDKNENCSYLLTVNCEGYEHELGKYEPAVISDIIRYVEENIVPKEEKRRTIVEKYIQTT